MLLRGTAIVSVLTLISRLLGFIRDLLIAGLLGASLFADAFFVAFRIPNLLRSFVAEGALTSAFTPVFSSALTRGTDTARTAMREVVGFLLVITTILTVLLILFAPSVIGIIAPGFANDQSKFELCVTLLRIMAPYIACISLIATVNAALNSLNIYGTSAIAQVIMNIVLIVGALAAMPFSMPVAVTIISTSVIVGGIIQVVAQIPACRRNGLTLIPLWRVGSPNIGAVVKLMIPATLGASIYQITIFIGTFLASLLPSGSVSWLFYADRIAQFPIGIFSVALASVLLPALAHASARADHTTFSKSLGDSLRFTSFCVIPMACGIWALSVPIVQMLFERGAFDYTSTLKTADALRALCWGLWAASCHSMLARAFIARRDTVTPSVIGLATLSINVIVSLLLMGEITLQDTSNSLVVYLSIIQIKLQNISTIHPNLEHVGLAVASSCAAIISLILILVLFCGRIGNFPWSSFMASTIRSVIASLLMVFIIRTAVPVVSTPMLSCLLGTVIGLITYIVVLYILQSRELRETLTVMRTKWQKKL